MTKSQKAVSFKIIEYCKRHSKRGRTRLIYECKIMFLNHIYNQTDTQLYKEQCLQFIEKQVVANTKGIFHVINDFLKNIFNKIPTTSITTNEQKNSII